MDVKIGFEIHVPLKTNRKLFCYCRTNYWSVEEPNVLICPVCTGMPGSKPFEVNKEAIIKGIAICLALNCKLNDRIIFLRKHYTYPDLPSGYQRTSTPVGEHGRFHGVGIREVHVEEDPGQYDPSTGVVDYNRSGCPLAEIVTEPDLHSPEEARDFLKKLFQTFGYMDLTIDKPGTIRFDVNVSVNGGERVEIKNVNSIKGAYRALLFEISRQKRLLESGQEVKRETRAYLESQMITVPMREKETAADYRYITDPDIPIIQITERLIDHARSYTQELPETAAKRLKEKYNLPDEIIEKLIINKKNVAYFEKATEYLNEPEELAKWIVGHLYWQLNLKNKEIDEIYLTPERLAKLVKLYLDKKISDVVLKESFKVLPFEDIDPLDYIEREGLTMEESGLEQILDKVIKEHQKAVNDYKSGKKEALNFLVGMVMKETRGKYPPEKVKEELKKLLD